MKNKIANFLKQNGVIFPCQAIMWMSEGNYLVKIFSEKAFCRIIEKFDDINLNEDGDDEESGSWEKLLEIVEFLDDESDSKYIFIESDFRVEINGKKFDPTIEVSPEVFSILKEVAITGTFSIKRDELAEKLLALGFKLVKTPTKKTEIMLVGEKTASLEKIKKAEKLGMRIIRGFDSDLVLNQLTSSSSINLGEYDFVKFKKGGECNICGKEGEVYGYPSESPAEAYCPACAERKINTDLRVARIDKNTLSSIFEAYDRGEIYDEDLGEALVSGNFLERFKFDPELFLRHFAETKKEELYFEFHRTPEGRCIRIMGDGNEVVYIYPLP